MAPVSLAVALFAHVFASDTCARYPLLPAYSHSDYRNTYPLWDALALGYRGVEADVYRVGTSMLVGHARKELQDARTLVSLYLDPLRERVRRCGYVLPDSTALLLDIELKEGDEEAFRLLVDDVLRYPDLFQPRAPGSSPPVQVALVGWWPLPRADHTRWPQSLGVQVIVGDSGAVSRDTGDRPIALVSIDYSRTVRWSGDGPVSAKARAALAQARRLAAAFAVPLRVHHAPEDIRVYRWLLTEGVTLIGTTDLTGTRELLGRRAN